jgi:Flp pilus assembly protein TadD
MLENRIEIHQVTSHSKYSHQNYHPYLKTSFIVEGLSIDPYNELLLKSIYSQCDSFYFETSNTLKIARVLAASNPSLQNLVRYGRLLDQKDLCSEAIQFFERALLKKPEDDIILFEIYKFLGNAYLKLGDIDSAEENYHKAFTIKPQSSLIQVNLGTLAIQKSQWHKVQQHFRQALKLNINQDKAWTGLAIYHHYMGDRDLSLANLKKALDLNPKNRTALLLLASWWPQELRKISLIERFTCYLDLEPEDSEISILLIKTACETQDFYLAEIEIEKLLCLNPHNRLYYEIYGQIKGDLNESKS